MFCVTGLFTLYKSFLSRDKLLLQALSSKVWSVIMLSVTGNDDSCMSRIQASVDL